MGWTLRHSAGYRQDLAELAKSDRAAVARIVVLFEEIGGDQYALEGLSVPRSSGNDSEYDVTWLKGIAHSERLNVWRLRIFGLANSDGWIRQRVLYAFDPKLQTIWLLAVMPRDENYDENSHRFKRIKLEYDLCGIPLLPR